MTREQILKKGGFPNTPEGVKAFYKKYNTPEKFFAEHGGSLSGAPHNGQPTADEFFSYGAPAFGHMNIPMSNPTYLAHGGTYFGGPIRPYAYGGSMAEYCWGGLPGGPNEMPKMNYGGYMDDGGYNSPTNYGSFSVPMDMGGLPMAEPGIQTEPKLTPEEKRAIAKEVAINEARLRAKTGKDIPKDVKPVKEYNPSWTGVFTPSGDIYQGRLGRPNSDVITEKIKNQKYDSVQVLKSNPNLAVFYKGENKVIVGPAKNTTKAKQLADDFNRGYFYEKDEELFPNYQINTTTDELEYGGMLDASNNQDYPMMNQGGMENPTKGELIKMLKHAAKQRKKAYKAGGNTSMQGGNANNIPQQERDNFINGVSNLYNNYMVDQETNYITDQINAMDQEMMPQAAFGMQSDDQSSMINQYQNYVNSMQNQNQSAFGNMLNTATNLSLALPGKQKMDLPNVSDVTKASEPVKAQGGRNILRMPEFKLTDKSQDVYKGIEDINRRRAEEEQRKSYAAEDQRRSYQNWNNTYNSGSQDPNKPWWEQPYRFSFNDPRGFAGMFPDSYYKFNKNEIGKVKEARDRNLPFTSMEATYGTGAKAIANLGKLFGKDPNETLTKFSPKKLRYYFGQPGTQQPGTQQPNTQQPGTQQPANTYKGSLPGGIPSRPYGPDKPEWVHEDPAMQNQTDYATSMDDMLPGHGKFIPKFDPSKTITTTSTDLPGLPGHGKFIPQINKSNLLPNVSTDMPPARGFGFAYGGMPMAQWGFANPVDMTMLGISNTKPEIYADAKLKKDWSAAAPMIPGVISNFDQAIKIAKNQKAIEQANAEMHNSAGKFAQAKRGTRGPEEINTQAYMLDRSMDSPFQTSAYSAGIGAYGGVFDDGGAYEEGEEYELSDDQIRALEEQGYVLKY